LPGSSPQPAGERATRRIEALLDEYGLAHREALTVSAVVHNPP